MSSWDDHHIDGTGFDSRRRVPGGSPFSPGLTVSGNVRFGMRIEGIPRKPSGTPSSSVFWGLVELQGFKDTIPTVFRRMKQRVGIARALAFDPEGDAMDEPFGALDAPDTRSSLQQLLVQVVDGNAQDRLFVTHSVRGRPISRQGAPGCHSRPGRIAEEIKIDLPRPRDALSVEFLECERKVAETLARLTGQSDGGPAWVTD